MTETAGPSVEDQLKQANSQLASYEARLTEAEALIAFLRERTVALDLELAHSRRLVADRDRALVALSEQLEGSS